MNLFISLEKLALEKKVDIHYILGNAETIEFPKDSFDAIVLIFAHFPDAIRSNIHHKMVTWLKPGGTLVLEAFNPLQLNNKSGGPKSIDMLYTKDMLNADFSALQINYIKDVEIELSEGDFHKGRAEVIRLIATK